MLIAVKPILSFSKLEHMRINHLATKPIISKDCQITNTVVCMKTGRVFGIHCWFSVGTKPGQWFFNQYCIQSTEEAYWVRTCCPGNLQLKHAPAAKKNDINKI